MLATRRSAALRMQAWLRMCLCRTFFRKVVQYADYAHDELLKALDGDQRMQAGQGEYLGTPFAFLWMRLGALPGGSVRRVGMQGKSSQETWRRQCLEAFLMYRAGACMRSCLCLCECVCRYGCIAVVLMCMNMHTCPWVLWSMLHGVFCVYSYFHKRVSMHTAHARM